MKRGTCCEKKVKNEVKKPILSSYKKCKKLLKTVKNHQKSAINCQKSNKSIAVDGFDEFDRNSVLGEFNSMRVWVKTLLSIYGSVPNIIKLIDGLVSSNATNPFGSCGNSTCDTYGQIEKIIDLCERKNKMLNIYILIKKLIADITPAENALIEARFVEKLTVEAVALDLKCTTRSVFRKINSLVDKLATFAISKGWSTFFIESQLEDEPWVIEQYNSFKIEQQKKQKRNLK